jgi:hypothetical protein
LLKLLAAKGSSPSKNARRNERFDRLEAALEALSPARREAIILVWIQGLPVKDAARRMGKSPDAVSMLILRGLRNLRKILGKTNSLRLPPRSLLDRFDGGLPANGSGPPSDPRAPNGNHSSKWRR